MKTLIITGFACPKDAWFKLFPQDDNTRILSLADILDACESADLRVLAKSVEPVIETFAPDVIVLHDFGVVLGFLALLNIRASKPQFAPKVIIFNGAFGGLNVFKVRHPFKLQIISADLVKRVIKASGGKFDERLRLHFPRIKKIYRQVILASIVNLVKSIFGKKAAAQYDLGNKMLIIASQNDPYIPFECLEKIAKDFKNTQLTVVNYGHYPYVGDITPIRQKIDEFISS